MQSRRYLEEVLVTMGDDVNAARQFMKFGEDGRWSYSAVDVVDHILSQWDASAEEAEPTGSVVPSSSGAEVKA